MAKKQKNTTLSQANALTESRYDFSKMEKNCIYKIIEKVRHDYVEKPTTETAEGFQNLHVTFPASILGDIADKDHRKDAHNALVGLRKRDVEINRPDGGWFNTGFINWCEFDAVRATYTVEVSFKIMPYLVELAEQYTSYSITVAMALKSVYSQRFYELCCQYRNNIEKDGYAGFHKTQEQLRQMFCLEDKYSQNQDFNRKVIQKAQSELKAAYDTKDCDLWFDYIIKGRGKNQAYDFKIYTREQSEKQKIAFDDTRKKWAYIHGRMTATFKRDKKFVERTMKGLDFNPNLIEPLFNKIQKLEQQYRGQDFAKLLRWVLAEDFGLN